MCTSRMKAPTDRIRKTLGDDVIRVGSGVGCWGEGWGVGVGVMWLSMLMMQWR